MKHFTVILPIFVLLCLAPETRAANYYWGGDLGLSSLEVDGLRLKLANVSAYRPQSIDIKNSDNSTLMGAAFIYGMDFGWAGSLPLRLEFEAFLSSGGSTINENEGYRTPQGPLTIAKVKMKLNVDRLWSAGLNLWLDVPVGSLPVKPYLGGGLGYNHISYDADITINPKAGPLESSGGGSGNKFAYYYKLGGGARMALGRRTFLDLGLRYAKKQDWSINAAPFELDFSSRLLDVRLGLRYYF